MAVWGGLLAGLGAGIGLAALMHVIVQASPENFSSGAGGSMFVAVVIAGPLIGLGLGLAFAGLVPGCDGTALTGPVSTGPVSTGTASTGTAQTGAAQTGAARPPGS